jgi:single-strand DNA-binding protein
VSYSITVAAGRVGRDAELRFTPSGDPVLRFSVATDRGWGDNKRTVWFNCSLWGERAEKLARYITKGTALLVTGEVDARAYLDRNTGEARASLDLRARTVRFLGGRGEGDSLSDVSVEESDDVPF